MLSDYPYTTIARAPPTTENIISNIVPPVVCYIATAFLVLLPRTQPIRVVLWPVTASLAFRAVVSLDLSNGNPKLRFCNIDLQLFMIVIGVRTLEWAVQTKPFIRHDLVSRPTSSTDTPKRYLVLDALDLACSLRGYGWDWSRGIYIPRETRPTSSRLAFSTATLISALMHAFLSGAIHSAVRSFAPDTIGSVDGGTIFDESLPPHLRYLRSSIIATLCAFAVYSVIRAGDELLAVFCVLILRQHPHQWPPAFDAPWRATSVGDFWGKRWHQCFRWIFIFCGGRPLSLLFGRVGGVMGTFLVSGLVHHISLLPLNCPSNEWHMMVSFGMMGVGVVLERAVAGKNVGGWMGWIWTMFWMVLWGNVMIDGWARAGLLGGSSFLDSVSAVRQPIERLVRIFDGYLHAR